MADINEGPGPEGKNKKDKSEKPRRGIDTMFRITAANQMRLSDMADNKAHILLTINSIIVSILLSVLFRKLDTEPELIVPGILFLLTSLITMVLAILVTMPRIKKSSKNQPSPNDGDKINLMFFGDFHSMSLLEYENGIQDLMAKNKTLYGSMIKDNYFLGKVLQKKYTSLRFAYMFFMVGFITAVFSFVLMQIMFMDSDSPFMRFIGQFIG
ncbi:Pycsar system effector family protein [Rufibacter radiotolerans]|uniref:Pycsar system effector family protein n=1 Tax=Rufibacter radiotolerans TaxID=1379910 RepID=UPI00069E0A06|nr:Pycsar system effector family protein [Rufibacter radiotolerans]